MGDEPNKQQKGQLKLWGILIFFVLAVFPFHLFAAGLVPAYAILAKSPGQKVEHFQPKSSDIFQLRKPRITQKYS